MLEALNFLKEKVYSGGVELGDNYQELIHSSSGCVTAVDGGACIIADGGSWVLSKIRVASVHYDNGKRVPGLETREEQYYTVIKKGSLSAGQKSAAMYEHSISELKSDFKNVRELTEVPAVVMRTLEFKKAYELVKGLPKGSLLLIDGLLKAETPDQEKCLGLLEFESKKQGINVVGIAKTFRHALNGRSVIGSLIKERPESKWAYSPVKGSDCLIVKLHERAKFAYAVDYFKHTGISEVLSVLSYYSTDPVLIGYPYPLLKVDRDARISSHEKNLERNKLRIVCKREGLDFIEYDEKSTSMHGVMDSQKYR